MTCVQGAKSRLALNGQQYPCTSYHALTVQELMDGQTKAITGSLQPYDTRWDAGIMRVGHQIVMEPTPTELALLMPLMGLAESPSGTFTLGESLTSFTLLIDMVTDIYSYTNTVVSKWRLQGARGSTPIRLILDLVGKTRPTDAATFSPTASKTDAPFPFHRGTMTLASVSRQFNQFVLACDFNVAQQYNNTQLPTDLCPTNVETYLATSTPYDSTNIALTETPIISNDVSSITGNLTFARGTTNWALALTALRPIQRMPDVLGKTEIRSPQFYRINQSASTKAIVATYTA